MKIHCILNQTLAILSTENLPSIEEQTQKVDAIKKKRDSWLSKFES